MGHFLTPCPPRTPKIRFFTKESRHVYNRNFSTRFFRVGRPKKRKHLKNENKNRRKRNKDRESSVCTNSDTSCRLTPETTTPSKDAEECHADHRCAPREGDEARDA